MPARSLTEPETSRGASVAWVAATYVALFLALGLPWLRAADRALPAGTLLVSTGDARVFTWTMAWVTHALATTPSRLFDANVFYPAPAQLAGGEHFLSNQLVFAPLFLLTSNALLSANLVAFLSYPLAALAMQRLAVAMGCTTGVAWVAGLVFALGPLRVPANLHVVQYLNFYLPLAALALVRLRAAPVVGRSVLLAGILALGVLSAYYLALMLSFVVLVWATFELARPAPGRSHFALLSAAAGVVAAVPALAVSWHYLARPEAAALSAADFTWQSDRLYRAFQDTPGVREIVAEVMAAQRAGRLTLTDPVAVMSVATLAALRMTPTWLGTVPLLLTGVGVCALRAQSPIARGLARRGVVMVGVGVLLMLGPALSIAGQHIDLPFALLAASPARFFRFPWRFIVVAGFGMTLLTAAGLEMLRAWLGPGRGGVVVGVVALLILGTRGTDLVSGGLEPVPAQVLPVYERVRAVASRDGRGPLLELPLTDPQGRSLEWEAMVGSTRHWLPLVSGIRSYPPPHADLLVEAIERLPSEQALNALVDMTHVCWLLLRPAPDWRNPALRMQLAQLPQLELAFSDHDWVLARVRRTPEHPEWFEAVASGQKPDLPAAAWRRANN